MMITVKKTIIAHTVGEHSKPWRLSKGDEVEEIIKKYSHMGYKFCNIKLPDDKILRHVPYTSLNINEDNMYTHLIFEPKQCIITIETEKYDMDKILSEYPKLKVREDDEMITPTSFNQYIPTRYSFLEDKMYSNKDGKIFAEVTPVSIQSTEEDINWEIELTYNFTLETDLYGHTAQRIEEINEWIGEDFFNTLLINRKLQ